MISNMPFKKRILIISLILLLCTLIITGSVAYHTWNKKFSIKADGIEQAILSSTGNIEGEKTVTVTAESDIQLLLKCIKRVKTLDTLLDSDFGGTPSLYTVEIYYENGDFVRYEYTLYPSYSCFNAFSSFYELASVQAQTH